MKSDAKIIMTYWPQRWAFHIMKSDAISPGAERVVKKYANSFATLGFDNSNRRGDFTITIKITYIKCKRHTVLIDYKTTNNCCSTARHAGVELYGLLLDELKK